MSTTPQVSVIIPVFEGERTVRRAIDSVLAQTFSDLEIIVVDDGSTDQSVNLISQYGSDRLRIIAHAQNRGAAAARNTGISAARGRWIAFLDSDDTWEPKKLACQTSMLKRASNSVAACATGYFLYKNEREQIICTNMTPDRFRRDIIFGCTISPGSTLLVERSVFETISFDDKFKRLEDWDWLLRFSERYDLVFVAAPLARIYLKPANILLVPDTLEAIRRMQVKHGSRFETRVKRMQFQSSLLVERAAIFHRSGKPFFATLYVIAALIVYPTRNMAFFKTLWRSVRNQIGR